MRVTDFLVDFLVAVVDFCAEVELEKFFGEVFGEGKMIVGYRQKFYLNGSKPHGERARIILNQNSDKAFD